jgi:hypothetical protein
MFSDGYISFSFPEIVGTIVTIVGIWLVVKQLNETRLASQAETLISLVEKEGKLLGEYQYLIEYTNSDKYQKVNQVEANKLLDQDTELNTNYIRCSQLHELIGTLVKTGALDKSLAFEGFGYVLPMMFRRLEKFAKGNREAYGTPQLMENWEWLTIEFEKMSR